jgi:hypothetical protein
MRRIIDLSMADDAVFEMVRGVAYVKHEGSLRSPVDLPSLDVLILGHNVTIDGRVLGAISAHGGVVIVLNDRFQPAGMLTPIRYAAAVLEKQLLMSDETRNRLQQQLYDASGTPRPAKTDAEFYGQSALRAVVLRSICSAGLHPALGIKDRQSLKAFALADDLMEPMLELVDSAIDGAEKLYPDVKRRIIDSLLEDVKVGDEELPLSEACDVMCQSLVHVLAGERKEMVVWRAA